MGKKKNKSARKQMFAVPTVFTINGMTYKVKLSAEVAQAEGVHGKITHYDHTILLDDSLPRERTRMVLLHELLHGIFEVSGLQTVLPMKKEERVLRAITQNLVMFLRNNDIDWLIKPDETESKEKA